MCTGLEIAGILASVGGSAINAKIQNDAIREQNNQNQIAMRREGEARTAEADRQRQFEKSQAELVANSLFEAAPDKAVAKAEEAAALPTNPINAAADQYNVPVLSGQVQNEDVNDSIGSTISKAAARTRELLRNAALLSGQGDAMNQASQSLGRMGSEVQTIGSNRRASGAVAGMETHVPAATVTPSSSILGDLLMLGGQGLGGIAGRKAGVAGKPRPFDLGAVFSGG